jgi:hypothetical protein
VTTATTSTTAATNTSSLDHWDELVKVALVGTDRHWALPPATAQDTIGAALHERLAAEPSTAPGQLLRVAGALALGRRVAWMPPSEVSVQVQVAAPESRRRAAPEWLPLLDQVMSIGLLRLQVQVLREMNRASLHVPSVKLPLLLQMGAGSMALREEISAVIGERGRWLAKGNPQWAYAAGAHEQADTQTLWREGSLAQRRQVLLDQRTTDPAAARERLSQEWGSLPAKERTALIECLAAGLNPDDESFLQTQLGKDRSQDVRRIAAELLSDLPGSAYALRMVERLRPLVGATVDAPLQAGEDWQADQLELKRPAYEELGERAWCLFQLVRRTPLSWWEQHTGKSPAEILLWGMQSDWKDALLRAWVQAAARQRKAVWCEALIEHVGNENRSSAQAMLPLLAPTQREQFYVRCLPDKRRDLSGLLGMIVAGCPADQQLSRDFSLRLLPILQTSLAKGKQFQQDALRAHLPSLMCILHLDSLRLIELDDSSHHTYTLADCLMQCIQVRDCRERLAQLASSSA